LVDNEPKEVRLPIISGSEHLKANYISDQTKKTHDYQIVGWLTTTVVLDSGLDSDHAKYAQTQTARHEFEQYDVIVRSPSAIHSSSEQVADSQMSRTGGTS
jgi:hypothetical protein